MKIIKQSWEFLAIPEFPLELIETAARTCYKTEGEQLAVPNVDFIRKRIKSGHHSVLEHVSITVKIITDRGVTHEIVRHRLASYSQESTRYCNYSGGVTFILPVWFYEVDDQNPTDTYQAWWRHMYDCEEVYSYLLKQGQTPQQARSVLPNSLKTEIVMTCNIREWRHFFTLRCALAAHPQIRDLAISMLYGFRKSIPLLFDDIKGESA